MPQEKRKERRKERRERREEKGRKGILVGIVTALVRTPKALGGFILLGAGVGISLIPIPVAQAVGVKMAYAGGTAIIVGLTAKTVRWKKAEKGKKWKEVTKHERDLLKKMSKKS